MPQTAWGQTPGGGVFQFPKLPRLPRKAIGAVLAALVAVVLFATAYYQIEPADVGVIQRFGKYVRTADPGPHLKIPFGIETVVEVPVQRQLKEEFGFRTTAPGVSSSYARPNAETLGESQMLTGDLNVAAVEWIVQYRIKDARAWLFHIRDVRQTFRYMAEAAMRQVVGDHSVDEVITIGREDVARQAKEELQRLCDAYGIGIEVLQLVLQDVNPPDPVKPAFNEVNQAIQEKERAINDAWAEYNQVVPRAKGEAEQAVRAAEGYAIERENNAVGDAKRFEAVYEEYKKAPGVTRTRIYLETMAQLLPKVGRQIVLDDKAKGFVSLLPLGDATKVTAKEVQP